MKNHEWKSCGSHESAIGTTIHYRCDGCGARTMSPSCDVNGQVTYHPLPIDLEDDGINPDCDLEKIVQVMNT
jgi:hypothetical protein